MADHAALFDLLAGLLAYPRAGYQEHVRRCRHALGDSEPAAAGQIAEFQSQTQMLTPEDLEELFVCTFEHNPPCALELGWHLFGENYERGALLVWMRTQLRHFGLAESAELPDHVTHALAVLGRMDESEARDFAGECVLPVLDRLRVALEGKRNPYQYVIAALNRVLTTRCGPARPRQLPILGAPPYESGDTDRPCEVCL